MSPIHTDHLELEPAVVSDRPRVSVVVPCYNEQDVLHELHRRLSAVVDEQEGTAEIVLVNDGSKDATWELMTELAASDPRLVCVNLSRNHGHQLALTAGLHICRGERIFVIDADLQDPPELLSQMMARIDAGADVVYGKRRQREGESAFKLITAASFYRIIDWMSDTQIPHDAGDFRLMTRRALDVVLDMPERHRFIRGMVSWIGFNQEPFLYDRDARFAGQTKYPLRKMIGLAKDAITAFSVKPLTFASTFGLIAMGIAVLTVGYAVISYFFFSTEPGWASVMSVVAFFGGVQLLVLGVIGEYLGRLYEQAKGRPLFVIDRVHRTGGSGPPPRAGAVRTRATTADV
ncbi:MAG: glycosyltransferase family 2 protein [Planctomycetota bacterium]